MREPSPDTVGKTTAMRLGFELHRSLAFCRRLPAKGEGRKEVHF